MTPWDYDQIWEAMFTYSVQNEWVLAFLGGMGIDSKEGITAGTAQHDSGSCFNLAALC